MPQVEVTVARTASDCPASPGTNLAFEADFNNISAQLRGRKLGVTTASTLEFDQSIGKWCLKNLTGSKSFDHQLESSVIEVGNNNLGCLRHVIKCEYSVKHQIFLSLIFSSFPFTSLIPYLKPHTQHLPPHTPYLHVISDNLSLS